jgi:hypothetical protein
VKVRMLALAALSALLCAGLLGAPTVAGAAAAKKKSAAPAGALSTPITGTAANGKAFTGTFTVKRFVTRSDQTWAVGTLVGRVGHRKIPARTVRIPVSIATPTGARAAATCQILDLVLAPIDLNLLGLKVHLDRVHLNITAESGPGNLLGNLLCSITGLLDQNPVTGAQQLTQLLNVILAILNQIAAAP